MKSKKLFFNIYPDCKISISNFGKDNFKIEVCQSPTNKGQFERTAVELINEINFVRNYPADDYCFNFTPYVSGKIFSIYRSLKKYV